LSSSAWVVNVAAKSGTGESSSWSCGSRELLAVAVIRGVSLGSPLARGSHHFSPERKTHRWRVRRRHRVETDGWSAARALLLESQASVGFFGLLCYCDRRKAILFFLP
jgi:hypothetical protein